MEDYLSAEQPIIDKVREALPELKAVLSAADLADVEERKQTTPAAHVIYFGDRIAADQHAGGPQKIVQLWLVVIAVRSARDMRGGSGVRDTAGPLIAKAIEVLRGFQPTTAHRGLVLEQPPKPQYREGFGYFPLQFSTEIFV